MPEDFWPAALEHTKSPGLANFYISLNCDGGDLVAALENAAHYQASVASECYFSWIIQAKQALETIDPQGITDEITRLFKSAFITCSNPRMLEDLHLE